jgi:GT2 family glycosyltransferase
MQLSIIIVNYNVKYFLEHCLLSVIKACKNIEAEILVVDNNSTDGSKEYLSPKFSSVQFFWNNENLGFGKANNEALKNAKGAYILFLNPDTIVGENCFINCINFFKSKNDCAAIGVRMIDGSGNFLKESKRCLPTATAGFYKMTGLSSLFPSSNIFAKYYAGHLPEKENNTVDVLAGAFMMLSKKAIEITNGFDESFFMYGEDIDLSYRITKAGLQNYYLGENTIIHFKGESTQKKSASYIKHFYGAIKLFVDKHYSEKPLQNFLMKLVVGIGKMTATIKQLFILSHSNKKTNGYQTLFLGNEIQFEKINPLLTANNFSVQEKTTLLDNLSNIISSKKINATVFCEGIFTNNEVINALENLPPSVLAMFYEESATSLVGSNNKNERGVFITKE